MIRRILDGIRTLPGLPSLLRSRRPIRLITFFKRFSSKTLNVLGLIFLIMVLATALLADILASKYPLAFGTADQVYFLPNLFPTEEYGSPTNSEALDIAWSTGGFVVLPPVPYGPNQIKVHGQIDILEPPGKDHLLGTDDKGRDVLARIIHGARSALLVGLGSVALYLLVAVLLGAVAGYFGGFADRLALRLIETLSSFPTFFLILAVQGLLGSTSLLQLVLVIGLTRWTDVARLTRAEVLRLVHEDYVTAARALGLSHPRILIKHVLPGAMEPAFVAATFGVAGAILIESTLSFLGFGAPSTEASWGQLLTDGFYNDGCYWLALFPGMILLFTILSINLVGEGLREALDPAS